MCDLVLNLSGVLVSFLFLSISFAFVFFSNFLPIWIRVYSFSVVEPLFLFKREKYSLVIQISKKREHYPCFVVLLSFIIQLRLHAMKLESREHRIYCLWDREYGCLNI